MFTKSKQNLDIHNKESKEQCIDVIVNDFIFSKLTLNVTYLN